MKEIGKYKIKINSTRIIDGILEEAGVRLEKRHLVLRLLANNENKQWKDVRRALKEDKLAVDVEKIGELMRINGNIKKVEEQIKAKSLRKADRFF